MRAIWNILNALAFASLVSSCAPSETATETAAKTQVEVKAKEAVDEGPYLEAGGILLEAPVTPLADGGAYVIDSKGTVWFALKGRAFPVQKITPDHPDFPDSLKPRSRSNLSLKDQKDFWFATAQREQALRRIADRSSEE